MLKPTHMFVILHFILLFSIKIIQTKGFYILIQFLSILLTTKKSIEVNDNWTDIKITMLTSTSNVRPPRTMSLLIYIYIRLILAKREKPKQLFAGYEGMVWFVGPENRNAAHGRILSASQSSCPLNHILFGHEQYFSLLVQEIIYWPHTLSKTLYCFA